MSAEKQAMLAFVRRDEERRDDAALQEQETGCKEVRPMLKPVVLGEAIAIMDFYMRSAIVQACEEEIMRLALGNSWYVEWGALQGQLPPFYNAPQPREALKAFLTRMRAHLRVTGVAVFWYERHMDKWFEAVARNHNLVTGTSVNGAMPHDLLASLLCRLSEGGAIGTGDRLPFGVADLREVCLFQETPDPMRPWHRRLVATPNLEAPLLSHGRLARRNSDLGTGYQGSAQSASDEGMLFGDYGFAVISDGETLVDVVKGTNNGSLLLMAKTQFAELAYRRGRLAESEKNEGDADWVCSHPRAILTTVIPPVTRHDTDMLPAQNFLLPTTSSVAQAVTETHLQTHAFVLREAAPLLDDIRGRCGGDAAPAGTPGNRSYQKTVYEHPEPLDDAVTLPAFIQPTKMSDPRTIVDLDAMRRNYERDVQRAMGLLPVIGNEWQSAPSGSASSAARRSGGQSTAGQHYYLRQKERGALNDILRRAHGLTYGLHDMEKIETILAYIDAAQRAIAPVTRTLLDDGFQRRMADEYEDADAAAARESTNPALKQRRVRRAERRAAFMRSLIHDVLYKNWQQRQVQHERDRKLALAGKSRKPPGATRAAASSSRTQTAETDDSMSYDDEDGYDTDEDEIGDTPDRMRILLARRQRRRARRNPAAAIVAEAHAVSAAPCTPEELAEARSFLEDAGAHFRALVNRSTATVVGSGSSDWKTMAPTDMSDVASVASGNIVRLVFYDHENPLVDGTGGSGGSSKSGGGGAPKIAPADVIQLREAGILSDDDIQRWLVEMGLRPPSEPDGRYLSAYYDSRPAEVVRREEKQASEPLKRPRIDGDAGPAKKKRRTDTT